MSLQRVLRAMAQHWVLVLIVLIAAGPLARGVGEQVRPVYEAKGTLLLLSPARIVNSDGTVSLTNPFTRVGNSERVAAATVLIVSSTKVWSDRMLALGATGKYNYRQISEAVIELVATASTPDTSLRTLNASIKLFVEELARRQERAGAPPESWITSEVLFVSGEPIVLLGSRIRASAGVVVLGAASAASLAMVAEAFGLGGRARRRARLRAARKAESPPGGSPDASAVPPGPQRTVVEVDGLDTDEAGMARNGAPELNGTNGAAGGRARRRRRRRLRHRSMAAPHGSDDREP
ncbi:MAG: hypothetical protein ACRD0Q_05785 [Acidimicrobiales bacterium]